MPAILLPRLLLPLLAAPAALAQEGSGIPAADPVGAALARARPSPAEERWKLIPWRLSLTGALAAARAEKKPVFLFGADGFFDTGNC